ncbi:hypothetical protein AB8Z38_26930 [Bradyrhizobium sp. LLZ17]|uniref:Uncharacterized protein n=1 Tax=Bradyrhizobium sp. LLZ17 TaxID=3239388 RepID=A0AB39XEV7_9BRAD
MTVNASKRLIDELGRKYLWWQPNDRQPFTEDRVIAQIMNLATYDDTLQLEATIGAVRLAQVMLQAEPGWFSDRSWEFWRGRLSFAIGVAIPETAPRRAFDAATP